MLPRAQGLRRSAATLSHNRSGFASIHIARNFSSRPLATSRTNSKRPQITYTRSTLLCPQSRSISWTGWWSSKPNAPEPSPSTEAVFETPSSRILDLKDPVKASNSTADTPDPSYLHGVPADQAKPELLEKVEDAFLAPTDGMTDVADLAQIPERIGYMTEVCGLQYWYGFTSTVQWTMEHIHVWGGLPWSVTIIATSLLIRVAFAKFMLMGQRSGARMREIQPYMQPLREDYKSAAMRGDKQEAMRLGAQMRMLSKESGIKTWHTLLPLIQVPFTFGGFRTLRNAADLPLPSMEAESFFWIDSLTASDPYILPTIIGVMTYRALNKQIALQGSNNPAGGAMVILQYLLPFISVIFCHYQLLAVQIWFLSQTLFTQLQMTLLNNQSFRDRFDLGLSPGKAPSSEPTDAFGYQTSKVGMNVRAKTIDVSANSKQDVVTEQQQDSSLVDKAVGRVKSGFSSYAKAGLDLNKEYRKSGGDREKQRNLDAYEQQEQQRQQRDRESRNAEPRPNAEPRSNEIAGMRFKPRKP